MRSFNNKYVRISLILLCAIVTSVGYENCSKSGFKVTTNDSVGKVETPCDLPQLAPQVASMALMNKSAAITTLKSKVDFTSFGQGDTSATVLSEGTEVQVEINDVCWLQQSEQDNSFLTQNVIAKQKSAAVDPSDVFSATLPNSLTLGDLENIADQNECIVSVFKNSTEVKPLSGTIAAANLFVSQALTQVAPVNDPSYGLQTYLAAVQHADAYDFFFGPNGIQNDVVVADISFTSFDTTHPDLMNNFWVNHNEIPNNQIDDDNNGFIDDIHGFSFNTNSANFVPAGSHDTAILGLIGAVSNNGIGISGVMSKHVKLMLLSVSDITQFGAAVRYAADNGANMITESYSGLGQSNYIQSSIQYAISKGVTIFAAAGNSGPLRNGIGTVDTFAQLGKTIPGLIAAGATDANPNGTGQICGVTSFDSSYVLGSPGCDSTRGPDGGFYTTYSPVVSGTLYSYTLSGTSYAAPIAASVAAAAYGYVRDAYNCSLTPEQLHALLFAGSKHYDSLNNYTQNGMTVNLESLKETIQSFFIRY